MNQPSTSSLVRSARQQAGLSQREMARKARTAQSVIARIELGTTSPSWATLTRILAAARFNLSVELERIPTVDRSMLDDIPRILRMTPEERLREAGQVSRFLSGARRV
ncbi:MAG: helix-turn-helix transcriptional regulator [Gemmatimonadales bacterium]